MILHYVMQLHDSQLVNIGSQYSYSSSDQSEFLVIVSRLVDERPEKDSHTTVKERVSNINRLLNPLYLTNFTVPQRSRLKNINNNLFVQSHIICSHNMYLIQFNMLVYNINILNTRLQFIIQNYRIDIISGQVNIFSR